MKRKYSAAAIIILLVAALFLLAGPGRLTLQKQVAIQASLYDISKKFTDLKNWPLWYPALKNADAAEMRFSTKTQSVHAFIKWKAGNQITITAVNPAAIVVMLTHDGKNSYLSLTGMPANNGNSTIVTCTQKASGWQWLRQKIFNAGEIKEALNGLKGICEDQSVEYGFAIHIEPVTDTIIATKKMVAHKKEALATQHVLYDSLVHFLQQQQIAPSKNYVYSSILPAASADSSTVAIGMPVTKKSSDAGGIQFLALPAGGRLLVGKYTGKYGQLASLYTAMNKYVKDKGMKIVAQPMEQHSNFKNLLSDSTQVETRLIYPVY